MKLIFPLFAMAVAVASIAQERVNPVIKTTGSVFEIPDAIEKPDPTLNYKIIIELFSASDNPKAINQSLNNVARLMNLHVSGGVPKENLDVVVVLHGEATYTLTDSRTYEKRYNSVNPNLELFKELSEAGVKLFVCGQSLLARKVDQSTLIPQVTIATSMLTTVTMHQLKGYAFLKF
jgi:intracellular sulfur oxidation DsrE/DsrF family protein